MGNRRSKPNKKHYERLSNDNNIDSEDEIVSDKPEKSLQQSKCHVVDDRTANYVSIEPITDVKLTIESNVIEHSIKPEISQFRVVDDDDAYHGHIEPTTEDSLSTSYDTTDSDENSVLSMYSNSHLSSRRQNEICYVEEPGAAKPQKSLYESVIDPNHVYVQHTMPIAAESVIDHNPNHVYVEQVFMNEEQNNVDDELSENEPELTPFEDQEVNSIDIYVEPETYSDNDHSLSKPAEHDLNTHHTDVKENNTSNESLKKESNASNESDESEEPQEDQQEETTLRSINDYQIKITKYMYKRIVPDKAIEEFVDVKSYMEQFQTLYGNQFIKVFDSFDGMKAILNYNIHGKQNDEILYVLCDKESDSNIFKEVALYTADELKKKYNIKSQQLPQICYDYIQKHLRPSIPNNKMRTIKELLHNKIKRDELIKSTRWTKVVVHKWYYKGNKSVSIPVEITTEEFIKKLSKSADNMETKTQDDIELIPIIEPNTRRIQYVWVVLLNHSCIQFHIGISLKFSRKNSIIVSSIFMSLVDAHQLVQFHHNTHRCKILDDFDCFFNDLDIGKGKQHKINELQKKIEKLEKQKTQRLSDQIATAKPSKYSLDISESFSVNITPLKTITLTDDDMNNGNELYVNTSTSKQQCDYSSLLNESQSISSITLSKSSTPLNPNCNEFIPGVTSFSNTAKLPAIKEEENEKYNL
eukprot:281433_1